VSGFKRDSTPQCPSANLRKTCATWPVTTFSAASRAHLRRATPTAGTGNASWREQPGESRAAGGPVISGKGRRGPAVAERQLSSRPSGGSPTARRAAALGCPGTGRSRSPLSRPDTAPHEQDQAVTLAPRLRQSPCERSQPPAGTPRIVQVGPSSVKGTPRSFLTASQKVSSGPTLERRSLYRPSGPDGKGQARGQARNARGKPSQWITPVK
jgi:hypothetical protein